MFLLPQLVELDYHGSLKYVRNIFSSAVAYPSIFYNAICTARMMTALSISVTVDNAVKVLTK